MHKKRIKGKDYFYTSYRDENGKINTKYLGSSERLARIREAEFKGLSQNRSWNFFALFLLVLITFLLIQDINDLGFKIIGASTFENSYQILAASPSIANVGIYNSTPYFNMSIFGYGNYSDADFDDSNGTSTYNWYVNGVLNQTGTTGQLLLCRFDNNYTCEEGETANITQYHTEFNTTTETIDIILSEENSSIVYFNIPRTAIITEAFMNVSGQLTSDYDLLQYDSLSNADYINPGTEPATEGIYLAGVFGGAGIDSWFLLTNMTNLSTGTYANILSFFYGNATETPSNGNFSYNIKICPTTLADFKQIPPNDIYTPDDNCTSGPNTYVNIVDTINLSAAFSDSTIGDWYNFTFNDNVSIPLDPGINYTLKFEFVDGDLSVNRYWYMYLVDNMNSPAYSAYNHSSFTWAKHQQLQLYSESKYPNGTEIDVCNDNSIDFTDDNQAFNTINTTNDFTLDVNTCVASCSDAYCDIPINVSSNSSALVRLEALRVSYDHYDLDGNFSQGMLANYTYTTSYSSDNNIHNHNGTLDMWVKPYWDGTTDANEYTFFTDSSNIIQLNKSSTKFLNFSVDGKGADCDVSSWTERTWHLITATWEQGGKIYLYIDGVSCDSNDAPASISALGGSIFIGSNAENNTQANATIDELRITGFPRSSDEISNYYSENRSFFQNEVFLNSTDALEIRRDYNITFELIPKDVTGATGGAGIAEEINISNYLPITPVLNTPVNDTYFSLQEAFSWYNSTDYDKDDSLYYLLYIGNDTDTGDFNPLTNYSENIIESSDPTSFFISPVDVPDGNYSWKVLSSDLTGNSSFTEPRVVSIDSTAPNLTLVSPTDKFLTMSSSENEMEIIFYFNVSESNPLENCTFNLNATGEAVINQILTHINQTENNFTTTLAFGGYNWTINCTDIANNVNTTGLILSFVQYGIFENLGNTTNFSTIEDPANVPTLVIENPSYGRINFTNIDVGSGANLSCITMSSNTIQIDDTCMPVFNTTANVTIFNIGMTDVYVQKDGVNCTECTIIDDDLTAYTFNILYGGTYTIEGVPPALTVITPTGGGGGGGGIKTLTKRNSFSLSSPGQAELRQFTKQMKQGATFFEKIQIINTGDLLLSVNLAHNMGSYLSLSQDQIILDPGEEKTVSVRFSALDIGLHVGNIVITASDIQKIVPVTLEVSSERVLVDAKFEVLPEYVELKPGDPLKAQVTLFNTAKKKVPVVVTYVIKDLEGNVIIEETETFDVLDKKSFTKTFDTSNLKSGQYVTGMNVRYLDSFATSSARFDIKPEPAKRSLLDFKWYYVTAIVSLFILVMLLKINSRNINRLLRRKKKELKGYEK